MIWRAHWRHSKATDPTISSWPTSSWISSCSTVRPDPVREQRTGQRREAERTLRPTPFAERFAARRQVRRSCAQRPPLRFTPHSLRATTATLLVDAGVDITKVQEPLDHRGITRTQIYDKRQRRLRRAPRTTCRSDRREPLAIGALTSVPGRCPVRSAYRLYLARRP